LTHRGNQADVVFYAKHKGSSAGLFAVMSGACA